MRAADRGGPAAPAAPRGGPDGRGHEIHHVVGRVGRIHAISNAGRDPAIALTLEELDAAGQGSFHQVVLRGADAIMALEAGLRSRDLIIVALEGLTARAYLDGPPGQGRPVGYLESRGRDPFVLDRPGPQDGLEEEKR